MFPQEEILQLMNKSDSEISNLSDDDYAAKKKKHVNHEYWKENQVQMRAMKKNTEIFVMKYNFGSPFTTGVASLEWALYQNSLDAHFGAP
ncbi:hypothetical protein TNCV_69931 [Trichonephila clavipes]|nr:hypothetical protein TNCV_69931 [Trichonephila clavipes]